MTRPLIFAALAVVVLVLAIALGGDVSLETLRAQFADWSLRAADRPLATAAIAFVAYVVVVAFSLPFAVWMTLGIGALFGFWWGLVIVSFASTLGATLAFLAARFLLRDWVRARFGDRLRGIDAGVARDGAFYLFTLRLIPVVPFFAVNLLMGLTPMPVRTFWWVSQAGMLAGTAVYVNAGTQLGQIESVAGIVSAPVLLSFAVLGLFPWGARWAVRRIAAARVYRNWRRPARFDRNLIVIGAGAAGLVTSYIAAATKAKVTLIERHRMGGDCLNYGCVPSKALIASAKVAHGMRKAADWGIAPVAPQVSFPAVMARVRAVIAAIEPHDSVERYEGLGVEVIEGEARLVDPWTVEVNGKRLTTRAIVLATGAAPILPPLPGLDAVAPLTSDTLWQAMAERAEAPARMVILGGGPIGCELAQAFARLGSKVMLVEMAPQLLGREDAEVAQAACTALEADGVSVLTGHKALRCGADAGRWIEVEGPDGQHRIAFDEILVAVGRKARLEGYGLETLGIPAARVIETNDYLETLYPNIFAAGDAAGPYQLTHAAAHQAWFAAVNALFGSLRRFRADYRVIPAAVFLDPEIARVGLNETEARAQGIAYDVTRYGIDDLDRAIADGAAQGFVKVLTVPGKDRILGVTIVGAHAAELLAEWVMAMKHGLGMNKVLSTIHSYPTWGEANKYAAGEWRRARVNPRLLALVERFHRWRRG